MVVGGAGVLAWWVTVTECVTLIECYCDCDCGCEYVRVG
jgi:hypothetical protein